MGFIYIVENDINEKEYVGKSILEPSKRLKKHFKAVKYSKTTNHFHNAIRKYGKEHFSIRTIWEGSEGCLDTMEKIMIAKYDSYESGYNSTKGGSGMIGFKHTQETKDLLSKQKKGVKNKNMSRDNRGNKNPAYGKKMSDETKMKISIAQKKRLSKQEDK